MDILANNCPFQDANACKTWDYEIRVSKLEAKVAELANSNMETRAELKVTRDMLNKCVSKNISSWELKRTDLIFPSLQKMSLHQTTPHYVEKLPLPLPANTKAVIISIFCNFWNTGSSHAYLNAELRQKGNVDGGVAKITNTHFSVYANTFYYEVFVPWNTAISNEFEFNVTGSYRTGGDKNWYRVQMVGYITA